MSDSSDIIINCPLCRGQIIYPPDREGEEVACPHCNDLIYLLSKEPPPPPPKPAIPVAKAIEKQEEAEAPPNKEKAGHSLHAATQQKLADGKRRATIKSNPKRFSATPPNRKKICTPESNVIKIPHTYDPVDIAKEGTPTSPEIVYRHPDEFPLVKKGGMLGKKSGRVDLRWTAVHVQERDAKPWVILLLTGESLEDTVIRQLKLKVGEKTFDFHTDAEGDRDRGNASEAEAQKKLSERFSFEHDDFRFLCANLVEEDELAMELAGMDEEINAKTSEAFLEYTVEFFEGMRRESPLYFR